MFFGSPSMKVFARLPCRNTFYTPGCLLFFTSCTGLCERMQSAPGDSNLETRFVHVGPISFRHSFDQNANLWISMASDVFIPWHFQSSLWTPWRDVSVSVVLVSLVSSVGWASPVWLLRQRRHRCRAAWWWQHLLR